MHKTHNESRFQQIQLKTNELLYFVWEKRFTSFLEIFSCVNHFENYGNKPLEILMNPFECTIWSKNLEIEYDNSIDIIKSTLIFQ